MLGSSRAHQSSRRRRATIVPSQTSSNPHNIEYLRTKLRAMGHAERRIGDLPQFAEYRPDDALAVFDTPAHEPPPAGSLAGSCLCGQVAFHVTEPFRVIHNCHCSPEIAVACCQRLEIGE